MKKGENMNELVKAVGREIGEEFSSLGAAVYLDEREHRVGLPCFFVRSDGALERQYFGARHYREERVSIVYIPACEFEKSEDCERTAKRLFERLEWLKYEDGILAGRDMRYEIKEGRLWFFVRYGSFFYKKRDEVKMGELEGYSFWKGR